MIIIGEKINATRKSIAAAIEARDADAIVAVATAQVAAGADYLDLNGGDPNPAAEVENMKWLVELVQAHTDAPLSLDSANPDAIRAGLELAKAKPIVNSVSLEPDRLAAFLPILAAGECMVVALLMSEAGMPTGVDDRLQRARELIGRLTGAGKAMEEIIVDPCFLPVSATPGSGRDVCRAIAAIKAEFPEVHVGGGLSNVSFGLPQRKLVNLAMVAAAVYSGMDTALIDPSTPMMVPLILATEVVSGADEWCANYVAAYREGKLE
ncbi:MAG TPA: dihydropteroate synthase [Phycisphaerae bacterium]|nr:dihydropteroate synthase [Phycisphaerae bacterium]